MDNYGKNLVKILVTINIIAIFSLSIMAIPETTEAINLRNLKVTEPLIVGNGAIAGTTTIRGGASTTFGGPIEAIVFHMTSQTATSTMANGLRLEGGSLQLDSLLGCNGGFVLETDASGNLQCGADAGASLSIGSAIISGTANRVLYEDSSNQLAESANLTFDGTLITSLNSTVTGTSTANEIILGVNGEQVLTASSRINPTTAIHNVSASSDIVLTSVPTIASSTQGHLLILRNVGTFDIDLQDNANLIGSSIFQGGSTGILEPGDIITFLYQGDADGLNKGNEGWVIQSHPNTQLSAIFGQPLSVRNASGSDIGKFKAVYDTGFNTGQGRVTVDLADADDPNKIPAIGITTDSISNGSNGTILTAGLLENVDTSSFSIGDKLYVDTTAGALTATKPTIDEIQFIALVTRSHATQGSVLIQGAGRTNDVPIDFNARIVNIISALWGLVIGTPTLEIGNGTASSTLTSDGQMLNISSSIGASSTLLVSASSTFESLVNIAGILDLGSSLTINGTSVLTSNTLGSGILSSSLTSVGTITSGTWNSLFAAGLIDGDDMNSNYAGAYLTETSGSPDTLGVDTEIFTYNIPFNMLATTTDSGIATTTEDFLSLQIANASTIIGFTCYTKDSGTSTIQIAISTDGVSAGTSIFNNDVAGFNGIECGSSAENATTTFLTPDIGADDWLHAYVSDAGPYGTPPRVIYGTFKTQKND